MEETSTWQRRNHNVEGMLGVTTIFLRSGERADDLVKLIEGARPSANEGMSCLVALIKMEEPGTYPWSKMIGIASSFGDLT